MKPFTASLLRSGLLSACAAAGVLALCTGPVFGQQAAPERPQDQSSLTPKVGGVISKETEKKIGVPTGPAPKLLNGKPDMSGIWQAPYVPDVTKSGNGQTGVGELPFTPVGLAAWNAYDASQGDYTANCLPFGLMRNTNAPHPLQIVHNPQYIAFLYEQNTWFRTVNTEGKPHPKDLVPTWDGSARGHWDGDTLVIDTIAFNDKTRLDTIGHPHSDQMHTTERYRRVDAGHISLDLTIDDPLYYSKPWKNLRTFTMRPDWEIMEYACEENNKDVTEGHVKVFTGTTPVPTQKK